MTKKNIIQRYINKINMQINGTITWLLDGMLFIYKWPELFHLCLSRARFTLIGRFFFVFLSLVRQKKRNLCKVMFTIRQHLSKSVDGKISRLFSKWWRELARAWQEIKHNLAEVSFFVSPEGKIQRNLCYLHGKWGCNDVYRDKNKQYALCTTKVMLLFYQLQTKPCI